MLLCTTSEWGRRRSACPRGESSQELAETPFKGKGLPLRVGTLPFAQLEPRNHCLKVNNLHTKYIKVKKKKTIWFGVSQVTSATLKTEDHDVQLCELFLNQGCLAKGLSVSNNTRKHLFLIHQDPLCGQVRCEEPPWPLLPDGKNSEHVIPCLSLKALPIALRINFKSTR